VLQQVRAAVPSVTDEQFAAWEKSGAIESMDIDGTHWYFHSAAANLFRVNPEARELKQKLHPDSAPSSLYRPEDVEHVIATYDKTGKSYNSPHRFRITYTLSVHPDAVPAGETVRAWLPYPHEGNRQHDIRLLSTEPARHLLADTSDPLSCVYLEKAAVHGQAIAFQVKFDYTSDAYYQSLDPARVTAIDQNDPALKPFLGEDATQILFTDQIKKLSQEIVGTETNPCVIAHKLFEWSANHLPWAPAREYSTIPNLPEYALGCGHGDCGIKTMTFMTLCRYNGIPAHWETGWTPAIIEDMHDWCEIYLPPYGWVPMDVTYGFTTCPDGRAKWFYFGGIDADRLVLNTNFCQPVYPAKTFYRSEIVDFQRGEAEWRGGNLYFNQWDYDFRVEKLP
jgi:transglutaminase-like putative cysteine protease